MVRSESNARWISAQYDSSSATVAAARSPAIALARKSDLIALSRKIGCADRPAAASPERNSRLVVIDSPRTRSGDNATEISQDVVNWRPPTTLLTTRTRSVAVVNNMTASRVERMSLLILYVEWLGVEHQHFGRREQRITLLGVVVVEQLESSELHRLRFHVRAIRIVFEPRLAPAIHVDDDLHFRIELNALGIGEHLARESMHDQNLGRKVVFGHQTRQQVDGVVHVARAHRPDPRAGLVAGLHRELGIDAQHHVGTREERNESRQLFLDSALSNLHVEKEKGVLFLRPAIDHVDQAVGHAKPVFAIPPGKSLGYNRDQVKRGLYRVRWISFRPGGDLFVEARQHLVRR